MKHAKSTLRARAQDRADDKADDAAEDRAEEKAQAKATARAVPVRVAVPPGQHVYSPLDDVAVFKHNGLEYRLVPNGTAPIVSKTKGVTDAQVAQYAVERLGMWGVCLTSGPVTRAQGKGVASSPEDQAIVDAAEEKYTAAMRQWAEEQVIEDSKANKDRIEAGLSPNHTNEFLRASDWLSKAAKVAK